MSDGETRYLAERAARIASGQGAYCNCAWTNREHVRSCPQYDAPACTANITASDDSEERRRSFRECGCSICKTRHVAEPTDNVPHVVAPPTLFPEPRHEYPVFTGLLMYFPNACAAVARCSYLMNEQHNPGEPMHWASEKSIGTGDQTVRHLMDSAYGTPPQETPAGAVEHAANHAWRAMEYLERLLTRKPPFAGATEPAGACCYPNGCDCPNCRPVY